MLNITLGVKLFCEGVQFFEKTLCDLDNFDVILGNTFLNAYKVDILHSGSKLKVRAKIGFKLMNLNVKYNYVLVEVGINLVALASELKLFSFLLLMSSKVS